MILSWSKEHFIAEDIEDFLIELDIDYFVKFHPTRQRQFDHIRYISYDTYIFFCDDDYYYVDRIKTILSYGESEVYVDRIIIVDSNSNIIFPDGMADFDNYVVRLDVCKNILNTIEWDKMSNNSYKTADVLFTHMLNSYKIKNINRSLYYRRQDPFVSSYTRAWDKDIDFKFTDK